jgi:uncharacterized protein YjbI with pentapeptide repeats
MHTVYIADKVMAYALFDGSDLKGAAFRCDNLQASEFANPGPSAVLTGASFTGDDLGSADFTHANLQGAQFALVLGMTVPNIQRQTDFSHADLSGSVMFNADLSGIDAHAASVDGAKLYNVNLAGADFSGASFRGATLGGAAADRQTKLPDGFVLSSDGRHVVPVPGHVASTATPIPMPESPCPVDARPHRFG